MADVKNFGIKGVGDDVQFGKSGPHLKVNNGDFTVVGPDGSSLINVSGADPENAQDFVTKNYLTTQASQNFNKLEIPQDDTDYSPGAISTWSIGSTTYSTAVHDLNQVLGLLVPTAPVGLDTRTITVQSGLSTASIATGATDNTSGTKPAAGTSISTVTFTNTFANHITNDAVSNSTATADGSTGTLSAVINGSVDGSVTFDGANHISWNNQQGALKALEVNDFPTSSPGFWKAFKAQINKTSASIGYNNAKLRYVNGAVTKETNTISWLYDNVGNAQVSSPTHTLATGTYRYSSSIPHMTNGDTLNVNATVGPLTGQTYINSAVMSLTTNPSCINATSFNATQLGVAGLTSFPLSVNVGSQAVTNRTLTINNNDVFSTATIGVTATNPKGSSGSSNTTGSVILVYTGTTTSSAASPIREHGVYCNVSNKIDASAHRLLANYNADNPNEGVTSKNNVLSGGANYWDSQNTLLTTNLYEAACVAVSGGSNLGYNVTNYTTGYIPVGPNLSSRTNTQYATFYFTVNGASQFIINLTGTYSGLWVKLPNYNFSGEGLGRTANSAYTTANGWMNASASAPAAGMPGTSTNGMGCAVGTPATGATGAVTCTFNNGNTTYSQDNMVFVRIKFTSGQSLSALSFT